jgi:hypothetical protein
MDLGRAVEDLDVRGRALTPLHGTNPTYSIAFAIERLAMPLSGLIRRLETGSIRVWARGGVDLPVRLYQSKLA